jgi:peptidoglycan/LPS O-acetylase OafA/YrhL
LGLAFRQGPVNWIMESRPVMFMGRISFSFYMIHYMLLKLSLWLLATRFSDTGQGFRVAILVATVGSCILLATATFYLFELPFQRLGSQILQGRRKQRLMADRPVEHKDFGHILGLQASGLGPTIEAAGENLADLGSDPVPLG